jgi:hypothetical protein
MPIKAGAASERALDIPKLHGRVCACDVLGRWAVCPRGVEPDRPASPGPSHERRAPDRSATPWFAGPAPRETRDCGAIRGHLRLPLARDQRQACSDLDRRRLRQPSRRRHGYRHQGAGAATSSRARRGEALRAGGAATPDSTRPRDAMSATGTTQSPATPADIKATGRRLLHLRGNCADRRTFWRFRH